MGPAAVRFYLDGQLIGTSTNTANIPGTPMHGFCKPKPKPAVGPPANSAAGNVQIDWVTAYTHN